MSTPEEKADEARNAYMRRRWAGPDPDVGAGEYPAFDAGYIAGDSDGYRRGVEDAAKIAEKNSNDIADENGFEAGCGCHVDIRALGGEANK